MVNENVIIASLVVLGIAILWIVFKVGGGVISAIQDERKRRSTKAEFQHPKFGTLMGEMEIWSGTALVNGKEIMFSVGGTETEPDEQLLEQLEDILKEFETYHKVALDYLLKENPSSQPLRFEFEDIDLLYLEHPDHFTINFTLEGDDEGIWRVEFEHDQPVFSGRDD